MNARFSTAALFALLCWPLTARAAPEGKVVIAQGVDATALDPNWQLEVPTGIICNQFYEKLFDREPDLKIVPRLATGAERKSDLVWRITLRKGVKFHHGEPFNAESVKFSLELIKKPEYRSRQISWFTALERVDIVDPYTVDIVTNQPYPPLVELLATYGRMMPPKLAAEKGIDWFKTNASGTGPFQFVRWVKGEEVVLEANPGYWGEAPTIKSAVFRPIPENTTRVAALQTGGADLIVNVPPHMARVIESDPKLRVGRVASGRMIAIFLDSRYADSPLRQKKVRQAINHAVNVDGLIASVMEGQARRIAGILSPFHFGYDADLQPYELDRVRARKLLAEAGYPDGVDIVFNGLDGRYVNDKQIAEAITGELAKAGIRAQLRIHDWGNLVTKLAAHQAGPMFLLGWGNATLDADLTYTPVMHSSGLQSNTADPELDRLIEQARTSFDINRRRTAYQQVARRIHDEAYVLPLFQLTDLYGINRRLVWEPRTDEQIRVADMRLR
jgi:peptide/nickel transport system substrate-binding protein